MKKTVAVVMLLLVVLIGSNIPLFAVEEELISCEDFFQNYEFVIEKDNSQIIIDSKEKFDNLITNRTGIQILVGMIRKMKGISTPPNYPCVLQTETKVKLAVYNDVQPYASKPAGRYIQFKEIYYSKVSLVNSSIYTLESAVSDARINSTTGYIELTCTGNILAIFSRGSSVGASFANFGFSIEYGSNMNVRKSFDFRQTFDPNYPGGILH